MLPNLGQLGPLTIPTHGFFVGLGVLAALVVFAMQVRTTGPSAILDSRQRPSTSHSGEHLFQLLSLVTGALVGGAIVMRLSGWLRHLDFSANPTVWQAWQFGERSILGGLLGAYLGVLVAKKLVGYQQRTGDLFAPAVALGMVIGRIGCLLTEAPGRPTSLPWGIHAPASTPECPGCVAGQAMHPSFAYEIAFHLLAFAALLWAKSRVTRPGALFDAYILSYAVFRFGVEFTRANETVWLELTRAQWVLLTVTLLTFIVRFTWRRVPRRASRTTRLGGRRQGVPVLPETGTPCGQPRHQSSSEAVDNSTSH